MLPLSRDEDPMGASTVGSREPGLREVEPADIAVRLDKVRKSYGVGPAAVQALRGVDLTIRRGELVSITGPSGCGKTTMLNLVGALDKPTSGTVELDGLDIGNVAERKLHTVRRQAVGFVFQRFYLVPILTALENVLVPAMPLKDGHAAYRERAEELLRSVGLGKRLRHRPGQLSGGEQQRVAVARALLLDPPLVLADEPTGNLDSASGAGVLELLLALNRDAGKTVIIVTHDAEIAARMPRTVRMLDGSIDSIRHA
ncbi:MAG: transporter related protein [Chloroflexi bacterium]|nr:transporter related protein [Chloroflexota bacterium]